MSIPRVLWVDDEAESLEPHRRFLEGRGYAVEMATNGFDAVESVRERPADVVLLDESMPGMSGLETLLRIKEVDRLVPVVMITRNDTEDLMDEAIGSQISDYLIKPVNPVQVLSSLKKIIDNKRLVAERTNQLYRRQYLGLRSAIDGDPGHAEWKEIHRNLIHWEMEMEKSDSPEMGEVHASQMQEADAAFYRHVSANYGSWVSSGGGDAPVLSHTLFASKVLPHMEEGRPLVWLVVDNLRYDHWKAMEPAFAALFRIVEEDAFYSILPTATPYSRNAMFAGMLPAEIDKRFPGRFRHDDEEGGRNQHEEEFLRAHLKRLGRESTRLSYQKVANSQDAQRLADAAHNLLNFDLSVVVYNFVDMLSHARTEMDVLRELSRDERGYRSLVNSWFGHSPLLEALRRIAEKKVCLVLCTDHGSVRVGTPVKVVGDRQTSVNLRYKHGRNLDYDPRDVLAFREPLKVGLPVRHVNSSYIFARGDRYLCYPNHFNHFANHYRDTFQHGGVSMDEMIVPVVRMVSR